jgi:hypothetical protein
LRTILLHLALILTFGIVLPLRKGIGFLDPVITSAYACMGVIFAAPAAAMQFGKGRPQTLKEAFTRAAQAAGYGEGLALILLAAGVATVNLGRNGHWRWPEIDTLAGTAWLGLIATITMALLAGWLTMRFSARAAQNGMRILLVVLLLAFLFHSQGLPDVVWPGSVLCAALAAVTIYLLHREVNPR